jgi:outer membrane protein assembly factor BamA
MFTLRSTVYSRNNEWMMVGDWRLLFTSQPTYGLGTGPRSHILSDSDIDFDEGTASENDEGELMDFNLIRFHQIALKQIKPNFYLGLGYHLDLYRDIEDKLLDLEAVPPVITNHYAHSIKYGFDPNKYNLSGLSANAIYDSRDNVANPYSGRYAFLSFRLNPEFLGSDQNSSTLWLEYRDYFRVSKKNPRNLIALWSFAHFSTSGQLPYMGLPAVGWDQMGNSGRAFPQGRWRGDHMYYLELEYRTAIPVFKKNPDLLGAVVFANMTTASSKDTNVDLFQYLEPGAGIGLRVMIQKESRTNLGIDYGWGPNGASALYINLNEYF